MINKIKKPKSTSQQDEKLLKRSPIKHQEVVYLNIFNFVGLDVHVTYISTSCGHYSWIIFIVSVTVSVGRDDVAGVW